MGPVSFEKAQDALTPHCLALMQNLSKEEVDQIEEAVAGIADSPTIDQVKALNLGLLLMNYVGPDVLRKAVRTLGDQITRVPENP